MSNKLVQEQSDIIKKQADIIKELKSTIAAVPFVNNKMRHCADANLVVSDASVHDKVDIVCDKGITKNVASEPADRHTFNDNRRSNSNRTRTARRAIEGNKLITAEHVASAVQAAIRPNPTKISIHVFRLSPTVSETDIKGYLNQAFPTRSFSIEKLNSRSDWYSSFKIDSDFDVGNNLLAAEFWPRGVLVRKFTPGRGTFLRGTPQGQLPVGQHLRGHIVELE